MTTDQMRQWIDSLNNVSKQDLQEAVDLSKRIEPKLTIPQQVKQDPTQQLLSKVPPSILDVLKNASKESLTQALDTLTADKPAETPAEKPAEPAARQYKTGDIVTTASGARYQRMENPRTKKIQWKNIQSGKILPMSLAQQLKLNEQFIKQNKG